MPSQYQSSRRRKAPSLSKNRKSGTSLLPSNHATILSSASSSDSAMAEGGPKRHKSRRQRNRPHVIEVDHQTKKVKKIPIQWHLEHASLVSELSRLDGTNHDWVILEIRLPLWISDATIIRPESIDHRPLDPMVERPNFYSFGPESFKSIEALLFDPRRGLTDVWANSVAIRMGTLRIPSKAASIAGQLFNDRFRQVVAEKLRHPFRVTLEGIGMYLDSHSCRSSSLADAQNGSIGRAGCSVPQFPYISDGDDAERIFKRSPVYHSNWRPKSIEDRRTWANLRSFVQRYLNAIENLFRAAALPSDFVNSRLFGRRPIVVRRYSGYVSDTVSRECDQFNRQETPVHCLLGSALELVPRSQDSVESRFCRGMLEGRVAVSSRVDELPCVLHWHADPSSQIRVESENGGVLR